MASRTDPASPAASAAEAFSLAAWQLPAIVGAIALSIVTGFYIGGPGLGMAVGALAATSIVAMAIRNPPRGEIAPVRASDSRGRVLVLLEAALEFAGAREVAGIVEEATLASDPPEVLLMSPCRSSFAERWTSDLAPGRQRAQVDLERSASLLAEIGIAASTRVGDEDVVQMTEDALHGFAATEVVLVEGETDGRATEALRDRLTIPLRQVAGAVASGRRGRLVDAHQVAGRVTRREVPRAVARQNAANRIRLTPPAIRQ